MPASTWSFVLSGAIVLMLTHDAHAQRLVSIDDKPVCGACRVTVNPVHTLAGNDSIALSRFSRAVIAGTSYIVTPTYTPAQIVVFDSAGQVQKVVLARLTTREVWHPVIGRSDLVQRTRALESGEIVLDIARLRLERR